MSNKRSGNKTSHLKIKRSRRAVTRKMHNKMHNKMHKKQMVNIVPEFLKLVNNLKMKHWNTHKYVVHKSIDEILERVNVLIDKFVEVLVGKSKTYRSKYLYTFDIKIKIMTDVAFTAYLDEFIEFMVGISPKLEGKDSDLGAIRDELVAEINRLKDSTVDAI